MYSDDWSKNFLIEKLKDFNSAKKIISIDQNLIEIERKKGINFHSFILSLEIVEHEKIEEICEKYSDLNFIVNIKKQYNISAKTTKFLNDKNISFGSLRDFMRYCNERDNNILIDKEFSFVSRGLRQHDKVKNFERLDNRRIKVTRIGLPTIVVIMINDYDITAESIRFAVDLYGDFHVVVKTNPNGSITDQAIVVGDKLKIDICKWGIFLGKLNSKWGK
ncbi:hypothetical protein [Chryseobacterium aquaticum]|uniref:hypothetical protein n=1 Tax=Chryseobacterium aquaticum TaxID=452084 RepID=UPI002FCAEA2D